MSRRRCKIILSDNKASSAETQLAKSFMDWASGSGPPNQLTIKGKLVTKASEIASNMNTFFMDKVKLLRDGISYIPNTFSKCFSIMEDKNYKLLCITSQKLRLTNF